MKRFFFVLSAALLPAGTLCAQQEQPIAAQQPAATEATATQSPASAQQSVKKARKFHRIQFGLRGGVSKRVKASSNILYGGSIGFFF